MRRFCMAGATTGIAAAVTINMIMITTNNSIIVTPPRRRTALLGKQAVAPGDRFCCVEWVCAKNDMA